MGHSVQLIIGKGVGVQAFLRDWPMARAVELLSGWQAIPMSDDLLGEIEGQAAGAPCSAELDMAPAGLERAMAEATRAGGALAYVETEYFGGTGGQSAMAFADGRETMASQRSRGGGAINEALRGIGVLREAGKDEFDTIGLGERRTMADYEPEGPVRLRRATAESAPQVTSEKGFVPLWLIALLIVAVIAVGVFVAVAN
ncbi:MAG: hypothetical protein Q8R82_16485 [Hyphomonadaceae bacterium]|nr:hypothetical protein [Hyphomonadaceae bacterium]